MRLVFSRRTDGAGGGEPDTAGRLEEPLPAEPELSDDDQSEWTEESPAREQQRPDSYASTATDPEPTETVTEPASATETASTDTVDAADSSGPSDSGEPDESDVDSADDGQRQAAQPNKPLRLAVAGMSLLTAALLALGAVFGVQWYEAQRKDRLGQEAVEVARQHSVNLVSINPDNIDKQMKIMLDGSTGDFKRQFSGVRSTFAQVVRKGKVTLTGSVDEAGISELSEEEATVLVAVKATVKNAQTPPDGRPSHYRFKVQLERGDDRWLVSGMQFVP